MLAILIESDTLTTTVLWLFVWVYPGETVPEETFTHTEAS